MRLTASGMLLAESCLYPYTPGLDVPYIPAGPKAERGTRMHAVIEALCLGAKSPHKLPPADLDACVRAAQWVNDLGATAVFEQPMAFAPDGSARLLPKKGHRDYSDAKPYELTGTADVIATLDDETVMVIDHKTGFSEWNHRPQLDTLAMMAARALGMPQAKAVVLSVRQNGPIPDGWPLDELDIDAVAAKAKRKLRLIQDSPRPVEGEHCRWCNIGKAGICPAKVAA